MGYRAERALSDRAEQLAWVVVDDDYVMQPEANAYLAALRARDRSVNTERVRRQDRAVSVVLRGHGLGLARTERGVVGGILAVFGDRAFTPTWETSESAALPLKGHRERGDDSGM